MESDDGDPTDSGEPIPLGTPLPGSPPPPPPGPGSSSSPGAGSPERLSADAVRALYEIHGRDLLTFLTGVLRNPDAAQDVSQATFQKLLESGHAARSETVRGWLFKVAFHEAMVHRRRQSRSEKLLRGQATAGSPQVVMDGSLQSLVTEEDVARLKQMLQELPAEQQFVVRQRIQEEKTFAAIADELNVPLGTVLTRMRLAVQKLQKRFGRAD